MPRDYDPKLVDKVVEILNHGNPDSQAVVLPLLAALPEDYRQVIVLRVVTTH